MEVCTPGSEPTSTVKFMTAGAGSSSTMVTATRAAWPNTAAVNRTRSVAVSRMESFTGVRVTAAEPRRAPAGTDTVKSEMAAKSSPAVAPSPVTETATRVSEANSEVAAVGNSTTKVTETGPPFSFTLVGLMPNRKRKSSSRMVREAGLTMYPSREEVKETVSVPSKAVSAAAVKLKVAVPLCPLAGMVTSTAAGAVKSAASAVSGAMATRKVADSVRAAAPWGTEARTITVRASPSST